eukprot:NODE_2860_length_632_cov_83.576329_g2380_i0.p1 GENE.NODE_2860_length_632_cov_83.576329_g2380_i0~~NODE_2860_length_632_cov_83.576329_g2380_i0.p1  ORF type:complete len:206 (-),score=47.03 NODE_2860_length_632_cov_83.576329_g2380_i0:14-565(-)
MPERQNVGSFILKWLTALACLCMVASNCTLLITGAIKKLPTVIDQIAFVLLRSYCCIFGMLMVATVLEWRWFTRFVVMLQFWGIRGLFLIFIGTLCISACEITVQATGNWEKFFVQITGFVVMGLGLVYLVLSLLCMNRSSGTKHEAPTEVEEAPEDPAPSKRLPGQPDPPSVAPIENSLFYK